jgi:hypothetical protein
MKAFSDWLKENHIELKGWQLDIAKIVLERMKPHRSAATGKTFILRTLQKFTDEHGDDFVIGKFPDRYVDLEGDE